MSELLSGERGWPLEAQAVGGSTVVEAFGMESDVSRAVLWSKADSPRGSQNFCRPVSGGVMGRGLFEDPLAVAGSGSRPIRTSTINVLAGCRGRVFSYPADISGLGNARSRAMRSSSALKSRGGPAPASSMSSSSPGIVCCRMTVLAASAPPSRYTAASTASNALTRRRCFERPLQRRFFAAPGRCR